jgi:cbb3-type cytochrome oxidase cytochrome c subunit
VNERQLYIANGCSYCHTQSIRKLDWGLGAERIAQAGDYMADRPILLGSERTGPDLSQAGGEHPDDWHVAHFINPRYPRPNSIMPPFEYLGDENIQNLTRYVQGLGFKLADQRMQRQKFWKKKAIEAYEAGVEANVNWLHSQVPEGWRNVPNPYPTTEAGLARGRKIYQEFCIGCHGPIGDGMGPAQPYMYPPPLNFTILKNRGISGGILYYQIMNGITGTTMPYFKRRISNANWNPRRSGTWAIMWRITLSVKVMPTPNPGELMPPTSRRHRSRYMSTTRQEWKAMTIHPAMAITGKWISRVSPKSTSPKKRMSMRKRLIKTESGRDGR